MLKKLFIPIVLLFISSTFVYASSKVIIIDLSDQVLYAKKGGKTFLKTQISTGRYGYETPIGQFKAFAKVKDNVSNLYPKRENGENGGAKMPYTIRVTTDGVAIHQGYIPKYHNRAYPDSHGCIRVGARVAKKLFEWTDIGTQIKIQGKPKYTDPANRKRYALKNNLPISGEHREMYYDDFGEWGEPYYEEHYTNIVYTGVELDYLEEL